MVSSRPETFWETRDFSSAWFKLKMGIATESICTEQERVNRREHACSDLPSPTHIHMISLSQRNNKLWRIARNTSYDTSARGGSGRMGRFTAGKFSVHGEFPHISYALSATSAVLKEAAVGTCSPSSAALARPTPLKGLDPGQLDKPVPISELSASLQLYSTLW